MTYATDGLFAKRYLVPVRTSSPSSLFLTKSESEPKKLYSIKYTDQMRKLSSNEIANNESMNAVHFAWKCIELP